MRKSKTIESGDLVNFIKGKFTSMDELIKSFDSISRKEITVLVGIDGCGGSGKSTFANKLKEQCTNATIVHMDDFYLPSDQIINTHPRNKPVGADFDWERLYNQVLKPLSQNKEGYYQRYDWEEDHLKEWHTVPVGGIVIIEGVYSIRKELANQYDVKIWVSCPREIRLSRGLDRDGEKSRDIWENNWMLSEDIYIEEHKPIERADIIVSGTN